MTRRVLVTGGGSGIGRAVARAFAAAGDGVTVVGRRLEALEETAEGFAMDCRAADVTDEAAVQALFDAPYDVVIANAGGQGYYRVTYSPELMQTLLPVVSDLEPAERFAVINDAWAFVESGQLAALDYLELALVYVGEENLAIWQALLAGLGAVRHHIVSDDALPGFRRTMATLLN